MTDTKGTPMEIPQEQEQIDWGKPEEHLAYFLQNMPIFAGIGAVTNFGFLKTWAKHLFQCGVVHRDYLARLADENGNIHVSRLPKQTIKRQKPMRGAYHQYNNAARWVPVGTNDPQPVVVQDPRTLTRIEQEAQLYVYKELGLIPDNTPKRSVAEVINEPKETPDE